MVENFEALVALAESGTMRKAALRLHITQSAVSKRIRNLENMLGRRLVEPRGRRVELTPDAARFVEKARPLLAELKSLLRLEEAEKSGKIEIDLSVSVIVSGGAKALALVKRAMPRLELSVNAHHASVAVERVRSGEAMLALVQGEASMAPDLAALPVYSQQMVLVPSGLVPLPRSRRGVRLPVIAIEPHTEAWRYTAKGLAECAENGFQLEVVSTMQSFSAIVELARAGFGHGLVPRGVAAALGVPAKVLVNAPPPGIHVPVSLIGRPGALGRPLVHAFHAALLEAAVKAKLR